MNDYHPFRSEIAKVEYLEYYDTKAKEWPLDSEERLVPTSYGQTFIRISGPEDAPPLVLLPGGGTASLMWKNNIEALSQSYRTLLNSLAPDIKTEVIPNSGHAMFFSHPELVSEKILGFLKY